MMSVKYRYNSKLQKVKSSLITTHFLLFILCVKREVRSTYCSRSRTLRLFILVIIDVELPMFPFNNDNKLNLSLFHFF